MPCRHPKTVAAGAKPSRSSFRTEKSPAALSRSSRGSRPRGQTPGCSARSLIKMVPSERAPRGRPPKGHVWKDGNFVHMESQRVFAREDHEAALKDIWRQRRKDKYAANLNGRRDQHVARLADKRRMKGARPRRKKLPNTVLRPDARDIEGSSDKTTDNNDNREPSFDRRVDPVALCNL